MQVEEMHDGGAANANQESKSSDGNSEGNGDSADTSHSHVTSTNSMSNDKAMITALQVEVATLTSERDEAVMARDMMSKSLENAKKQIQSLQQVIAELTGNKSVSASVNSSGTIGDPLVGTGGRVGSSGKRVGGVGGTELLTAAESGSISNKKPRLAAAGAKAPPVTIAAANAIPAPLYNVANSNKPQQPLAHEQPKHALYGYYGKCHNIKLVNEFYYTWDNGGKSNDRKFTSLFLCPITGEIFQSGSYGENNCYGSSFTTTVENNGTTVYWYQKKANAEHAAAARTYDCWLLRDISNHNIVNTSSKYLCHQKPYLTSNEAPSLPIDIIPSHIYNQIYTKQQTIITQQQQSENC